MTPKTPTPQGISTLLRKAGFRRSERQGRSGPSSGYRVGKIYGRVQLNDGTVTGEGGAIEVRHAFWSMGGMPAERYRQELERYAPVIEAAGFRTEIQQGGRSLIVTAKPASPLTAKEG
jgi:hypothetical protein